MPTTEEVARELRLQIGRNRRRIDRRFRNVGAETQRLRSWRTYARWLPGSAMLAAFGIGLALSAGLGGRPIGRWLGLRLVRRAWGQMRGKLLAELLALWRRSAEKQPEAGPTP